MSNDGACYQHNYELRHSLLLMSTIFMFEVYFIFMVCTVVDLRFWRHFRCLPQTGRESGIHRWSEVISRFYAYLSLMLDLFWFFLHLFTGSLIILDIIVFDFLRNNLHAIRNCHYVYEICMINQSYRFHYLLREKCVHHILFVLELRTVAALLFSFSHYLTNILVLLVKQIIIKYLLILKLILWECRIP